MAIGDRRVASAAGPATLDGALDGIYAGPRCRDYPCYPDPTATRCTCTVTGQRKAGYAAACSMRERRPQDTPRPIKRKESTVNSVKPWTPEEDAILRAHAHEGRRGVAVETGRTASACMNRAYALGISLRKHALETTPPAQDPPLIEEQETPAPPPVKEPVIQPRVWVPPTTFVLRPPPHAEIARSAAAGESCPANDPEAEGLPCGPCVHGLRWCHWTNLAGSCTLPGGPFEICKTAAAKDPLFAPTGFAAVATKAEIGQALADMESIRTCRVCGCTDDQACEGGCTWVEDDLCSACVDTAQTADAAPRGNLFPVEASALWKRAQEGLAQHHTTAFDSETGKDIEVDYVCELTEDGAELTIRGGSQASAEVDAALLGTIAVTTFESMGEDGCAVTVTVTNGLGDQTVTLRRELVETNIRLIAAMAGNNDTITACCARVHELLKAL
jgi:hypothetical protein